MQFQSANSTFKVTFEDAFVAKLAEKSKPMNKSEGVAPGTKYALFYFVNLIYDYAS